MNIITNLKYHLDRSTPIIAITSPDPISLASNALSSTELSSEYAVFTWDIVTGFATGNPLAAAAWASLQEVIKTLPEEDASKSDLETTYKDSGRGGDPSSALELCKFLPGNSVVFIKHAAALLKDVKMQQALMNLRNHFKINRRSVVLVSSWFTLPECLRNDTVIIDEPLPDRSYIESMIGEVTRSAGLDFNTLVQDMRAVVDAVSGLPSFQTEQALALSIQRAGFDIARLIKLKEQLVNQTKGLSVHFQADDYQTIGGLEGFKGYINRLMTGNRPPQVIVWLDEFDKSGINYTGDSNGINADLLGTMLSYMEDTNVMGICLHGVPGSGKSAVIKATGAQFNRIVIRLDLGAMKGSYVGESETNLRAALRLINALGQGNVLLMATTNSLRGLDSAMKSRFSDTFFFGLPTGEELEPIWDIQKRLYGVSGTHPLSLGWVGRNVKQCCYKSARLNQSLEDAARTIVPVGVSAAKEIQALCQEAKGQYLCANTGNIYQ
jgi:hypothetical protein